MEEKHKKLYKDEILPWIKSKLVSSIKFKNKKDFDVAKFFDYLRQLYLRRCHHLMKNIFKSVRHNDGLAACFHARALLETIACFADLSLKVQNCYQDLPKTQALIKKNLLAGRYEELFDENYKCINVLTAIDNLTKKRKLKNIRKNYDFLSEYTHPNSFGLHYFVKSYVGGKYVFSLNQKNRDAIKNSLLQIEYFEQFMELFDQFVTTKTKN
jgi:hypothetical protein